MAGVCKYATQLLPPHCKKTASRKRFCDTELKRLCDDSKQTWSEWVAAGRPTTGELFDKKKSLKRAVRHRINTLEE